MFLNLNGIPTEKPPKDIGIFFTLDGQGVWRPNKGDLSFDVEAKCVRIHDALIKPIFGNRDAYHAHLFTLPQFIPEAGLNSEARVSRSQFEQLLTHFAQQPYLNNFLYLYDCQKLVAGIQECSKEASYLLGEFYHAMNFDELFPPVPEPDGIRWVSSPATTRIIATMNFLFIRLHSLLDYTTKLVYEIEHMRKDFSSYPKLSSTGILFGRHKRLSLNGAADTVFERSEPIIEIELVRNLIIHDGFLDDMPKIYKMVKSGKVLEKFILMPDKTNGRLERFTNRNLFYGGEDKINLRLPLLLSSFQARLIKTLELALAKLSR